MMDACMKLKQHANTAKMSKDMRRTFDFFFGEANDKATGRSQQGPDAASPVDHSSCTMRSNYGKPCTVLPPGPLRAHAVVGACCPHGVPLLSAWIVAQKPECYLFYDEITDAITSFDPKTLEFAYLDFGCQFGPHYWRRIPEGPLRTRLFRFVVPWFHACGHTRDCQDANGGLLTVGAGHEVGEQMEQTWPLIEKIRYSLTYMSDANFSDCLSIALVFITERKRADLFGALEATQTRLRRLIPSLEAVMPAQVVKASSIVGSSGETARALLIEAAAALSAPRGASAAAGAGASPEDEAKRLLKEWVRLRYEYAVALRSDADVAIVLGESGAQQRAATAAVAAFTKMSRTASVSKSLVNLRLQDGVAGSPTWADSSLLDLETCAEFKILAVEAHRERVQLLELELESLARRYAVDKMTLDSCRLKPKEVTVWMRAPPNPILCLS